MKKFIILIAMLMAFSPLSHAWYTEGNAPSQDSANGVTTVSNGMEFEGATADASETTLSPTDATADRTVLIPNASGTLIVSTAAADAAASFKGIANGIEFEGATADTSETQIVVADPSADTVWTFAGTVSQAVVGSTLTTNDTQVANSVWMESGSIIAMEGATADGSEARITTQDPTADVTVTIPAGAFKVGFSMYGTEAQAPTCAAALGGSIYVASNSTDADDCTMASGTGTAHNVCVCDGSSAWVDAD